MKKIYRYLALFIALLSVMIFAACDNAAELEKYKSEALSFIQNYDYRESNKTLAEYEFENTEELTAIRSEAEKEVKNAANQKEVSEAQNKFVSSVDSTVMNEYKTYLAALSEELDEYKYLCELDEKGLQKASELINDAKKRLCADKNINNRILLEVKNGIYSMTSPGIAGKSTADIIKLYNFDSLPISSVQAFVMKLSYSGDNITYDIESDVFLFATENGSYRNVTGLKPGARILCGFGDRKYRDYPDLGNIFVTLREHGRIIGYVTVRVTYNTEMKWFATINESVIYTDDEGNYQTPSAKKLEGIFATAKIREDIISLKTTDGNIIYAALGDPDDVYEYLIEADKGSVAGIKNVIGKDGKTEYGEFLRSVKINSGGYAVWKPANEDDVYSLVRITVKKDGTVFATITVAFTKDDDKSETEYGSSGYHATVVGINYIGK